jgi:hypothetical protein
MPPTRPLICSPHPISRHSPCQTEEPVCRLQRRRHHDMTLSLCVCGVVPRGGSTPSLRFCTAIPGRPGPRHRAAAVWLGCACSLPPCLRERERESQSRKLRHHNSALLLLLLFLLSLNDVDRPGHTRAMGVQRSAALAVGMYACFARGLAGPVDARHSRDMRGETRGVEVAHMLAAAGSWWTTRRGASVGVRDRRRAGTTPSEKADGNSAPPLSRVPSILG